MPDITDNRSMIDLSKPTGFRPRRGFTRPAFYYTCPKGHKVTVLASAFRGKNPEPAKGAIYCPHCDYFLQTADR